MENELLNTVLKLYREEKWEEILDLNKDSEDKQALKILWVWPNQENLKFIKTATKELNVHGIISVGCGCGLLEWILCKSTGLPVVGIEINREWWESKYSNPNFIDLKFIEVDISLNKDLMWNSNYALLFCYFNDSNAFKKYIEAYSGNVVVIIGPGKGSGRHTNPQPFTADFGSLKWTLYKYQEVKNTKDFIAFYRRLA